MFQSYLISTFLIKELRQSPEKFYSKFLRPKMKYGSPQIDLSNSTCRLRSVTKPSYSLKELQKSVKTYLEGFALPSCMYGGVREGCSFDNVLSHVNNRYFCTIDLKDFFGKISNSRVHQTLIKLGHNWNMARNITHIATLDGCLPQGAPTSNILANLVFAPTALLLEDFCKARNITFTVYTDDLTFSSLKNFNQFIPEIVKILKCNKFPVNHNKVHYRINNCEVTGIIIDRGKLTLPAKILKNINKPGVRKYITYFDQRYEKYLESKKAALLS